MGSKKTYFAPESNDSYMKTLHFLCQMMTKKNHQTPLPICSQLANTSHSSQEHTVNDDPSHHSQNISLMGLLGGAFFILLMLAVVTWRKAGGQEVI